jgi:hypothetical protein
MAPAGVSAALKKLRRNFGSEPDMLVAAAKSLLGWN